MKRWLYALAGLAAVAVAVAVVIRTPERNAQCGTGFTPSGARCLATPPCPKPLVAEGTDCVAPDVKIEVPDTTMQLGPSDWEAEGLVAPRTVVVKRFALDAFELTVGQAHPEAKEDRARAAGSLTRDEARALCKQKGGRLPTEDEWIVAAATSSARRYPWGDTGVVCRRAAFGLVDGPCAHGATGPDTVAAHPDGDGALGIHDLAGNVAEWVEAPGESKGVLRGGSYRSTLAADLRTWARAVVEVGVRDPAVGGRCAYDL